jgi:hypothetical protein
MSILASPNKNARLNKKSLTINEEVLSKDNIPYGY